MKIDQLFDNTPNGTCAGVTRQFGAAIKASLESTGKVPDELEDTITATIIEVDGKTRAIINWA
jgi:hypothetical protein